MSKYKAGAKSCNLTFLIFFANYWGIGLPVLMGVDFESVEKISEREMNLADFKKL